MTWGYKLRKIGAASMQSGEDEEECMKLTRLTTGCFDGTCPTIYQTDRGTIVVQGWAVRDSDVTPPEGEALVEIPAELLKQINV